MRAASAIVAVVAALAVAGPAEPLLEPELERRLDEELARFDG